MSTSPIEVPLFPLNVVLFPGMVLPLHIFEHRYRVMIQECQQNKTPFGVVLARPESEHQQEQIHSIGTLADIYEIETLEDGRYNLIAIGGRRFHVLQQYQEKPYLSGLVECFDDQPEKVSELYSYAQEAHNLFGSYLEMLLEASNRPTIQANIPKKPDELSYFIAYLLDIEDEQKQHFLEITSTEQRLQEEIAILRREVPFLRQMLVRNNQIQSSDKPDRSMLN